MAPTLELSVAVGLWADPKWPPQSALEPGQNPRIPVPGYVSASELACPHDLIALLMNSIIYNEQPLQTELAQPQREPAESRRNARTCPLSSDRSRPCLCSASSPDFQLPNGGAIAEFGRLSCTMERNQPNLFPDGAV
jgi:hypothetical protein